jgi:hypothetical protein
MSPVRRRSVAIAIVLVIVAGLAFIFLVPIPVAAMETVNPTFLMQGGPIYGSVAAKYLGYGAVLQTQGTWPFHGLGHYCIQYPYYGGTAYDCFP